MDECLYYLIQSITARQLIFNRNCNLFIVYIKKVLTFIKFNIFTCTGAFFMFLPILKRVFLINDDKYPKLAKFIGNKTK